ncbi:hypothetical protein GH714_004088 [Hevea brasiliensis]|uniref:Tf2-1-like SH3-like domain-containing protein n=1 Tax=Hevea brasiliensis TaxID=3981 RepID=A0A6A6MCC1_HEVBR|nr:hypothetical protein GH714_004088 [Hevea brasiliensis]
MRLKFFVKPKGKKMNMKRSLMRGKTMWKETMKSLGLPTKKHPNPYILGWIKITADTIKVSFSVVYKKMPQCALDLVKLLKEDEKSVAAKHMAEQVVEVHKEVKLKLEEANKKYKEVADEDNRKQVFELGDKVMVFQRHERFLVGIYSKLQQKKYGPYEIIKRINDNSYVVDLPNNMGILRTFNAVDL